MCTPTALFIFFLHLKEFCQDDSAPNFSIPKHLQLVPTTVSKTVNNTYFALDRIREIHSEHNEINLTKNESNI